MYRTKTTKQESSKRKNKPLRSTGNSRAVAEHVHKENSNNYVYLDQVKSCSYSITELLDASKDYF